MGGPDHRPPAWAVLQAWDEADDATTVATIRQRARELARRGPPPPPPPPPPVSVVRVWPP